MLWTNHSGVNGNMTELIGKVRIDDTFYSGTDLYSDGDAENEILDIVQRYPQDAYKKIIAERKNWPVLYHLSEIRENILNWYPFEKDASVLEIGAGCGAVTGCIASKVSEVTCIELSKRRSLINAYRHRNSENITILTGNFETIEKQLTRKYDYITLIGVFEYAASYLSGEHPYNDFLEIIMEHLKEKGKLLLAIENKLGMKYWAGCQEDHFGGYFLGIEGYPGKKGILTFSKAELEHIIRQVPTVSGYEFYYPYPDYKFPMAIYSDGFLPQKGSLNMNIRNFDMDRYVLFDETKAFDSVLSAGLFQEFSNSFLVSIEKGVS